MINKLMNMASHMLEKYKKHLSLVVLHSTTRMTVLASEWCYYTYNKNRSLYNLHVLNKAQSQQPSCKLLARCGVDAVWGWWGWDSWITGSHGKLHKRHLQCRLQLAAEVSEIQATARMFHCIVAETDTLFNCWDLLLEGATLQLSLQWQVKRLLGLYIWINTGGTWTVIIFLVFLLKLLCFFKDH